MDDQDRAIIVGIRNYPGLGEPLDGPENDARQFNEWVTSPSGGNVRKTRAKLILSSNYRPMKDPVDAKPAVEAIQREIDALQQQAEDSSNDGSGFRIGRRLYLYFSGHGFEPKPEEVALLTANATRSRGYHIAGKIYADYFRRAGIFDEVVLFMDCCRGAVLPVPLSIPPYVLMQASDAPEKGKRLNAFATKWSRNSREKMIEGVAHGIFTAALLKGLWGEARDASGQITAESLANYLYEHMKDPLTAAELADPAIPKQPDVDYDKDPNNRLVILGAKDGAPKATGLPVVFKTRPESKGKEIIVRDGRFQTVFQAPASAPAVSAKLAPGFYMAQIMAEGVSVTFQVPGNEPGGVTHVGL